VHKAQDSQICLLQEGSLDTQTLEDSLEVLDASA
jgi:hypothetical protein